MEAKEAPELTEEQMLEIIKKNEEAKIKAYVKENITLSEKHNLQVAMIDCPSCQGKGVLMRVVARENKSGG